MKKLCKYLLLILVLTSCEEKINWDIKTANNPFIVVDGIITSELKPQTISLSRPVSMINELAQPVSGATVLVSLNQLVYTFHEDMTHRGKYISDIAFQGIRNKSYTLLITAGAKAYSANAVMTSPEKLTFVEYQLNAAENKYRFTKVPFPYNPEFSAMFEILLDWSLAPGYEKENPDSCKQKLFYYTLKTIDVSEVFAPGMVKITFPPGTLITERRYSLTDEHAAFIRAMLLETTWQGGYFNTATANIPTNLSEGAVGYFGACGVVEEKATAK